MKKIKLLILILMSTFLLTSCQEKEETAEQRITGPFILTEGEDGKYFVSSETNEILSDVYEDAYSFELQNNYARVKKNGKWGVINDSFVEVIPCEYDYINEIPEVFVEATGVKNGKACILHFESDEEIEVIELDQYNQIEEIHNGWFCLASGESGMAILDASGNELLMPQYKTLSISRWLNIDICIISTQSWDGLYGAVLFKEGEVFEMIEPFYSEEIDFSGATQTKDESK